MLTLSATTHVCTPRINLRAVGIRRFSVTQLPVTLEDIDEVWDQVGSDSGSDSGASSSSSDRPPGSTGSSSDSVRSPEGGGGSGGAGAGAGTFPAEQAVLSAAQSAEANVLERAELAAVESESLTASEPVAQVAVTPSTSKASDKRSEGDGGVGDTDRGNRGSEGVDRRPGDHSELNGAAVASEAAQDFASPGPSSELVVAASVEDTCETDGRAPVQDETSVEEQQHAELEATARSEEPVVSECSINNMAVRSVEEGRIGQQNDEEESCIDRQADGSPEAEVVKGGNGERQPVEQDQKDGLAGPGEGAAERVEPTVGNDGGDLLHREPSLRRDGAEKDQINDNISIIPAERVDGSGAAGGEVTTHPVERVKDTPEPDSALASDPGHEVMKHPTEVDTPRDTPVEDGNGDAGESSLPNETRSSRRLVYRTLTGSLPQGSPLAAGGSEQDSADIEDAQNDSESTGLDRSHRLDDGKALEKETREQELNAEGQAALGDAPVGVGGTGADQDHVDTSPAEAEAASISREGGVEGSATDEKNSPLVASRVWEFPPKFEALVTLSPANEAVECTVEGEIAPELRGDSRDNGVLSWKSVYCLYKIAAKRDEYPASQADINLEDDDAQARLEDLLEREYGLSMEDVLERFSPDTDLGSGEAVVRSFTDSICLLRPSLLVQPQTTKGEGGQNGGGDSAVHKAVGAALRGGGKDPEWREIQVRVDESRVLEVGITTSAVSTTIEQRGQRTESNNRVVDCSSVASPTALIPHLLSGGVPASAVDALERAGFAGTRSVVDLAGVLAALAREADSRKRVAAQSTPTIQIEGGREWPWVDPDRDGTHLLRLASERRGGSLEPTHEYRVAVTGSSERVKLEVSPVLDGDDAPPASVVLTTISCLRSLGTPVVVEKGHRSETKEIRSARARESSSARTPQPEDSSSSMTVENKEADTAGLNVGDRVEARFGGKTDWFAGTVRTINTAHEKEAPSGGSGVGGVGSSGSDRVGAPRSNLPTIAIDYDDGDVEERVPRVRVRLPGQKQPRFLNEGDEVDVKRGKKISLARVIVRPSSAPREEGHYDLQLLDDGRRGVRGGDAFVENCPRSAIMALHGWPPGRK